MSGIRVKKLVRQTFLADQKVTVLNFFVAKGIIPFIGLLKFTEPDRVWSAAPFNLLSTRTPPV